MVFVQPGAKVDSSYYYDVVLNQGVLPDIQKLSGNKLTFQQDGASNSRVFVYSCARICEPENWLPNSPDYPI